MQRKASFNAVADLIKGLSDEEQTALVDNPAKLKAFVVGLLREIAESTYFTSLSDDEAAKLLAPKYRKKEAACLVRAWRKFASDSGYTGPVVWKVRAGFTLKLHAPKAGRCYDNWKYLQGWELVNDKPTEDTLIFWIPVLLPDSPTKTVNQQMELFVKFRKDYKLPEHHLSSFGSAAELAGLIMAHAKRTGKRVPERCYWARTDTLRAGGDRLNLGVFDGSGLYCDDWYWGDGADGYLGCFALGVEALWPLDT